MNRYEKKHENMADHCALLLVIGLGLSVAALAAVDFDVSRLNTEGAYERRTYTFDAEQLKSAEIQSVSQDIRVVGRTKRPELWSIIPASV